MNHHPLDKYNQCCVCGKIISSEDMFYFKPEILGTDYFSDIGSLCSRKCFNIVFDEEINKAYIPPTYRENYKWIERNIINKSLGYSVAVDIEKIIFLCKIGLSNNE